ncbi:hypothetical protein Lgee_1068 [Legionella geestiana]|uniref:Probable inorganic carbon transporter subunit DabA n=1 Tax=Legionella geestiana TaxID=45065 RepID=A0A0W0TXM0_9GAMM|nr:DUF2309 domain-containing protein [Legionella geestiana]KTD00156.1 hypothetical protein Lgee_1068 [Legionella geestiana]QBS11800.1 DUF2309 domain-containing protein [Legionella geestiana]QDQ40586.1 DUF2309 domain-containing protein [Legionella geestiana]STX53507.1 putative transmembrane protein [Legionella geestiana]
MSTAVSCMQQPKTALHSVASEPDSLERLIEEAARVVPVVWPLQTFIANNPLQGLEGEAFSEALSQTLTVPMPANTHEAERLDAINAQCIKWCSALLDTEQATIPLPWREEGLYPAFQKLVTYDATVHQHKASRKAWLKALPLNARDAVRHCLDTLGVAKALEPAFISEHFSALPGWAGRIKWQEQQQRSENAPEAPARLIDFLAMRLVLTCMLWPDILQTWTPESPASAPHHVLKTLESHETRYRDNLLKALLETGKTSQPEAGRPDVQCVFCIDVRSEPLRRAIESLGRYETFGFAGFFGLPVRVHATHTNTLKVCCPVLLQPAHTVHEHPLFINEAAEKTHFFSKSLATHLKNAFQSLKYNFSTPFTLAEFLGPWCGLHLLIKSLMPKTESRLCDILNRAFVKNPDTKPIFEGEEVQDAFGLTFEEQLNSAENILRLMSLDTHFAKIILLCGHGGSTVNNPYASALDCGACGGNHGFTNAKMLAAILNKPEIRGALEDRGIHIPLDTVFYGACHDTTTDTVNLFLSRETRVVYPDILEKLMEDLHSAKIAVNEERAKKLECNANAADIEQRSQDWSETRPEWGLASNAAFIAAPRHLTRTLHLDGRCFLHSYDWTKDPGGTRLETILTAPLVVAQWINAQYLFSSIDNARFGSGSKITHNVTGKFGIMQGNASDLMHGLPLQSVARDDERLFHTPQRLQAFINAKASTVLAIVKKHKTLHQLAANAWIFFYVLDSVDGSVYLIKNGEQGLFCEPIAA